MTVDTDAMKVLMLWKGEQVLRREPTAVGTMAVSLLRTPASPGAPPAA